MARKRDPKDILLLALYAEYNRDSGDYRLVRPALLDMDHKVWLWSLMMLKTDGLVDGVKWIPPGATGAEQVLALNTKQLRLTREGAEAARELIGADSRNRKDAILRIIEWISDPGMELLREHLTRQI